MTTIRRRGSEGGLVYSTDGGRMCPACRRPVAECICRQAAPAAGDGIVRVSRQTAGRAGKGVTVVTGLALAPDALAALGKRLRSACGAGGTVRRDGTLEIQGEHRDALVALLEGEGYKVKRAGGQTLDLSAFQAMGLEAQGDDPIIPAASTRRL